MNGTTKRRRFLTLYTALAGFCVDLASTWPRSRPPEVSALQPAFDRRDGNARFRTAR
jgi:hypothetical protein